MESKLTSPHHKVVCLTIEFLCLIFVKFITISLHEKQPTFFLLWLWIGDILVFLIMVFSNFNWGIQLLDRSLP